MDDVHTAAAAGADELIVDLNLQDWFTSTRQMLETAVINITGLRQSVLPIAKLQKSGEHP